MRALKKSGWVVALAVLCFFYSALAETIVIDANEIDQAGELSAEYVEQNLTAGTQYLCVSYDTGETETDITLCVENEDTGVSVYGKQYGRVSGTFQSDEVYLKFTGNSLDRYTVTLTIDDRDIVFPFNRKLLRLTNNTACSYGMRFAEMNGRFSDSWLMGTVVDLTRDGTVAVPLVASNMYKIGQMKVTVSGGTVEAQKEIFGAADASIKSQALYVLTDVTELMGLSDSFLRLYPTYDEGEKIDIEQELAGSAYAIVFWPMTLSYDPNGLEPFSYSEDPAQNALFDRMEERLEEPPVG